MSLLSDIGGFFGDIKDEADQIGQPIKDLKQDLTNDYHEAKQGITEPISQVTETVKNLDQPTDPET